jgi:HD-GYP domain-containing protein (c-di-GMP phosphodiesterase class II)
MRPIAALVRSSHERWDGAGYPDGLKGDQIPLGSRIIFISDAFDAMTSDRPYKRAIGTAAALAELRRCGGSQFDPELVAAFCEVVHSEPSAKNGHSPTSNGHRAKTAKRVLAGHPG